MFLYSICVLTENMNQDTIEQEIELCSRFENENMWGKSMIVLFISSIVKRIEKYLEDPRIRIQRDKINYTFGFINIMVNVALFSGYPQLFVYYFCLQLVLVLPVRVTINFWRRFQ